MAISRSEGYRLAIGKEKIALSVVADFLDHTLGVKTQEVIDPKMNFVNGDLMFQGGGFIECKSQPINPVRYPENFVEICELTHNPLHSRGFETLRVLAEQNAEELASRRVYNAPQRGWTTFGFPEYLSVSIGSIFTADFTIYVNPKEGEQCLYLYLRDEITTHIRNSMKSSMVRGAGRSNEDTFAVKIPLPQHIWVQERDGWKYRDGGTFPGLLELMH